MSTPLARRGGLLAVLALLLPLLAVLGVAAPEAEAVSPAAAASDVSFTSAPSAATEATWAAFSFSSERATSYRCSLDGAAFAPCTDATRGLHRVNGLSTGEHTLAVRSVDAAGAEGQSTTASWTVVRGPTVDWVSKPAGTIANSAVTAVFSAEQASYYQCSLDGTSYSTCTGYSNGFHQLTDLTDGDYGLHVRAVSTDGTPGPAVSTTFTIAAPLGITWTSKPTGTVANNAVTAMFSAPQASYYECSTDGTSYGTCTGYSNGLHQLTDLTDGEHRLHVRAVSPIGLRGPVSSTTFTIAAALAVTVHGEPIVAPAGRFAAVFSAPQASSYECALDDAAYRTCSGSSAGLHTLSDLSTGSHSVRIRAVSPQGGRGPAVTVPVTSSDAASGTSMVVRFNDPAARTRPTSAMAASFHAVDAAYYLCALDEESPSYCSGSFERSALAPGDHTLTVTPVDAAGSTGASAVLPFTVGSTESAELTSRVPATIGTSWVAVAHSAPRASYYLCALDSETPGYCGSTYYRTGLTDGDHVLRVRAVDVNGQEGPELTVPFAVDTKRPITLSSGPPLTPETLHSSSVAISHLADQASYYLCALDTETPSYCGSTYYRTGLTDGDHVLRVRGVHVNGQEGPELAVPFTVDTKRPVTVTSGLPVRPDTVHSSSVAIGHLADQASYYLCALDDESPSYCGSTYYRTGLTDGDHVLRVRGVHVNGQEGPELTVPFTVDTRRRTHVVSAPHPTELLPARSVAFSYVSPGATSYSCSLDGGAATACGTASSATYFAQDLPPGKHVLTVTASGDSGAGAPLRIPFHIRKDAPETTLTSAPPARTNQTSQSISFSGTDPTPASSEPGPGPLTFVCTLDGTAAPCTSPASLTGLTEAFHTFTVAAVNDQGRPDPSPASVTWFVDLTAPAVTITGGPTGTVTTRSATVTFVVDPTATSTTCQLDGGQPAPCTGSVGYLNLADGPHTVAVRATDDVGNVGTAIRSWTVDTTPPALAITSGPSSQTDDRNADLAFTTGDATTVTCSLDDAAASACTSPMSYSGLALGDHVFSVTATDAVGNSITKTHVWRVISGVPVPNTVIDAAPPGLVAVRDATLAFSADVTGATFECSEDGGGFTACTSPVQLTGLVDGLHTFAVRAVTEGGPDATPATASWSVDATAPVVVITSGPPASTSSRTASLAFTVSDASATTTTCGLDGAEPVPCSSPVSYSDLAPGEHTVVIVAKDAAGNASTAVQRTWTVLDTLPVPDTTITSGPTGTVGTRDATFTFESDVAEASFECSTGTADFAPCTSPHSLTVASDGGHTFVVRAVTDGGADPTPATRTWVVDTTAPRVVITSGPAQGSTSPTYAAAFAFTVTDASAATSTCQLDSGAAVTCAGTKSYSSLSPGLHTFRIKATDAFGRSTTVARSWTVGTATVTAKAAAQRLDGTADSSHGLGDDFRYALTVSNSGTGDALSTRVTATLGSGLNTVTLPSGCTASGQKVTCNAGTVGAGGGSKTFYLRVEGRLSCTRWGTSAADTVSGTTGSDVLCGGGSGDTIRGNGGNDVVWGYGPPAATGSLDTTPGATWSAPTARSATGSLVRVTIAGTDGADNVVTGSGADVLHGAAGNDVLNGGLGNDVLEGDGGDDRLSGSGGLDTLRGDDGNDWLYGEAGNDRLDGGSGDDDLWAGDGDDTVNGDAGQDLLYGGYGADRMTGGTGHDYLVGSFGNDNLNGGTGRDRVYGEDGNDVVDGGPASGTRTSAPGDHYNQLYGGIGDDACSYGPGTGTDNTDYRHGSCERLAVGGASAPGRGWLNGSAGKLDRGP